jgi:YebC/PmpR family DNA-binding regulatory protein
MAGHSKWKQIKHYKAATDAKRGALFTKLIREITVAAKAGGGDPDGNPRLRTAIDAAKASSMPKENIERAIKKGTGELEGVDYSEVLYEAYGPGGVALMIQTLTDNKNRTVSEIRYLLGKHNGNLAAENSVAWMFSRKGQIIVEKDKADEEKLLNAALEAGADDMNDDGSAWEIVTSPESFEAVRDAIKALGVELASAEIAMVPQNYVKLTGTEARQMLKLYEAVDDHDDVQHVWANFDIEEKEIEALA